MYTIILILYSLLLSSSDNIRHPDFEIRGFEIVQPDAINVNGIFWCFRCKCLEGSGYCMVMHFPATVGCDGGNFEGACTQCSLELYRSDGPCVDGGF